MPTVQCGEFRVWFGTDDAPAPVGSVPRGGEQAVRVGVLPRDSDIVVRIRYRRQGGSWMSLPTRALPGTGDDGPQYYEVLLVTSRRERSSSTRFNASSRGGTLNRTTRRR